MKKETDGIVHLFRMGDEKLVLDCYSGALHSIDEPAYEVLEKLIENGSSGYIKDEIRKNIKHDLGDRWPEGVLDRVIDELNELVKKEQLFSSDKFIKSLSSGDGENKETPVKALCLNLAHNCNMTCKYCFAEGGSFGEENNQVALMSFEIAKKAIDFLLYESKGRKNCEIDFFGGEPLLNWKVLTEAVRYAREKAYGMDKNIKFTLTTNGILLDENKIQFLNDNDFAVVLSLDGRKDIHDANRKNLNNQGTYEKIVPKFQKLVQDRNHREYFVRGTYTADNLDFSADVMHIASLGFRDISIEPVVACGGYHYSLENADFRDIEKEYRNLAFLYEDRARKGKAFSFYHFELDLKGGPCLKKRYSGCGAGVEYLAITPLGEIYPCHQFVGNEEFLMGDLNKGFYLAENIKEIFKSNSFIHKKDCYYCWAKFFCGGGCHANAYLLNGSLDKPYGLGCKMEKTRLECALYLASKGVLQRHA